MNDLKPDLSKPICRICLENKIDEEMSSIFDMDTELHDLPIYEKIERCVGTKIVCDTMFPTFICCHCNECLRVAYKFCIACQNSEEYLKVIVEAEVIQPKEEKNISNVENTNNEDSRCTYNRDYSLSPIPKPFKDDLVSYSPALYEETIDEYLSDNGSEVWMDINYPDGDDILSCGENIETPILNLVNIKEEKDKTPVKSKKRPYVRKKKSLLKTLDISSDGAAIIKERKPRAKREHVKQPHVCEICGNVYKRRHILEHHVKRHSDEKDFECEICGYAFHSNFELRRHMRKHTGARPYKCNYCPKAFGDHSTLTKHERVHRNERPFKCDICGSSFSYPGVLKRHKLVHTGEKPYKCEICGKCFNDRYHLRSHLKTIQHRNDPRVELLIKNITENNV